MTTPAVLVLALLAAAAPTGDDEDLRDLVVLRSGEELRGRVVRPYAPDTIELVRDGDVVEVERADVVSTSTVAARLSDWLDLVRPGLAPERQWELVELAAAAELDAMARVQAYRVLLLDPDHAAAHAFLDHAGKPGRWRWRLEGRLVSADRFRERTTDRRSPLELETEHFLVRTNAGLERATEVALDLERLYAVWMDEVGSRVDAREVLRSREPMIVHVDADQDDFRPLTSGGGPYYDPGFLLGSTVSHDNAVRTYVLPGAERPERLVDLAVQQLLYTTVLGEKLRPIARDTTAHREAACLEVGLGDWFERRWEGPAGYGRAGAWRPDRAAATLALRGARSAPLSLAKHELPNLVMVTWNRLANVDEERDLYWAKCRTFVAFLMEDGAVLPAGGPASSREAVMALVRRVYGVPTGNASTAWDDALGSVRLEALEPAWRRWLELLP